jgi:hypothetical protein
MTKYPSCILIDDIGEGLDYERSASLIKLIIKKVENTSIQLVMATNDRFVMNSVPIEYWSIIDREASHCKFYNQKNSAALFKDFELTGLSNFDFFSSGYFQRGKTK